MAEQKAIPVDKADIPYRADVQLADEIFTFEFHYNALFDYFTIHLEKAGERIINGEKIVYGRPLFSGFSNPELPKVQIIPRDVAGIETRVGYDQMGESVFLFVSEAGS